MKKADSRQKGRTKGEETPISAMVKLGKERGQEKEVWWLQVCANTREEMFE